MAATTTFYGAGGVLTAALGGEIDHHTAACLRTQIDEEIARRMPQTLILDFSGVGFMDSSGIGLILSRCKRMQAIGGQLRVRGTSPQIDRVLALAGIQVEKQEENNYGSH
ncbi:MAG TPA: anti-sigma factor antagonist [Candidatus Anaerofilum faecale]|nr:anti-sigma factor antagonist [Anaerofilum sp. An201]HIX14090.1 anti-sigma factor antagonist [Candidatus Anaerofilum faecale]